MFERPNLSAALEEIGPTQRQKLRKLGAFLRDRTLRAFGPYVANQNVIYKLEGSISQPAIPAEFEFLRCTSADQLPRNFWKAYHESQPSVLLEEFTKPFRQDAVLSIGVFSGKPTSYLWSSRFGSLQRWYLQLEPDDIIIFSVVTFFPFRGLGLASMMVRSLATGTRGVGNIYLDVKRWNVSAKLAFEKAGFKRVAVRPPLPSQ